MITFLSWPLLLLFPLPLLFWQPARQRLAKAAFWRKNPNNSQTDLHNTQPLVQTASALYLPFLKRFQALPATAHSLSQNSKISALLALLVWGCCIVASARPMWFGDPIQISASARDILLAVDVSGSMETADFQLKGQRINRLQAVKVVLSNFIRKRENDRVGLILFGSNAYLQAPLTFDRKTVLQFLSESRIGIAGPETAIGDAIGLGVKRFQEITSNNDTPLEKKIEDVDHKVLILVTDGANTAGEIEPKHAATLAANLKLTIHTIGVGASEMLVSRPLGFGTQRVNPSKDLDETTLKTIAKATGGQYFRANNTEDLASIYDTLDKLEAQEIDESIIRPQRALFHWPLAGALFLQCILLLWQRYYDQYGQNLVSQGNSHKRKRAQ